MLTHQFHKSQPKELPMTKKPSSTTVSTMKPRHGRCGKSQNGFLQRDLFSLNFSFPPVIHAVLNTLCQESLNCQLKSTRNVKNTVLKTLCSSVVLVLPRLQSLLCSQADSTQKRCFSRESTSQVPPNQSTSKNLSKLKSNVNRLVFSFHQMENSWLSSLMICLCLSSMLGVIRLLLKSLVNLLTKKVSISLKKILVVFSNKSRTFNS